jgi:hypothetical protein
MYSPGKALVVYEMRRHVCFVQSVICVVEGSAVDHCRLSWLGGADLADGTVTGDHALYERLAIADKDASSE